MTIKIRKMLQFLYLHLHLHLPLNLPNLEI